MAILSEREARNQGFHFLKSRRGMNFAETSLEKYRVRLQEVKTAPATTSPKASTAAATAPQGEQLIGQRGCTACHRLGDRDGRIAPDLSFEGLVRDADWMMDHFRDPRSRIPDSIMPSFGFPEDLPAPQSPAHASRTCGS
jgi:mono/diheme cytochrome c family protein